MKDFSGNLKRIIAPGGRRRIRTYLAGLTLLAGLLAMGCAQGAYPLDIFYEMHYQPSYKAHEPPRLSPPESAVPFFDPPAATSFNLDGQHLYEVNCSMCHGAEGQGDGEVLSTMMEAYGYEPVYSPALADLNDGRMIARDADVIRQFVRGDFQVPVMPNFSKLLTPAEIDAVSRYVADCLQGANPAGC